MSIYQYTVKDMNGNDISLEHYRDKVMLIINSATACGFTPQYEALQSLYEQFKDDGFIILDFPCNQFGNQAPGTDEEISSFCETKFGVSFPIFSKIEVNGEKASPLYQYLVEQKGFKGFDEGHPLSKRLEEKLQLDNPNYLDDPSIKWNFTKFLIDSNGDVVERFEPTRSIDEVKAEVEKLLKK